VTVWPAAAGDAHDLPANRLLYTPGDATLVVSFDNAGSPHREPPDRPAWGHKFYTGEGHAVLGVIAKASDWYRDPDLHAALIELRDTGFFARFDRVMMTGSSMGGYGATAFAGLAPGCHVLSFNPQSTLRSDLVPWETNHPNGRIQDWIGPFADAATEARAAAQCYVFYDPYHFEDRRHADRYSGPGLRHMRVPFMGHGLPQAFQDMGMLKEVMRRGIAGTLEDDWFYTAVRARRSQAKYYKTLAAPLARGGHLSAGATLMARAYARYDDPYFRYREAMFRAGQGDVAGAFGLLEQFDHKRRASKRRRR
jgi:hypothetical protein